MNTKIAKGIVREITEDYSTYGAHYYRFKLELENDPVPIFLFAWPNYKSLMKQLHINLIGII